MVLLTRGSGRSGADWRLQLSAHVVRSLQSADHRLPQQRPCQKSLCPR